MYLMCLVVHLNGGMSRAVSRAVLASGRTSKRPEANIRQFGFVHLTDREYGPVQQDQGEWRNGGGGSVFPIGFLKIYVLSNAMV